MRVLIANKFWYARGGQERVAMDEARWLEESGHQVAHFASAHPDTEPTPWMDYFVPYIELGEGADLSIRERATAVRRLFSNPESQVRFSRLLTDFKPDIIHIHGIARQISPSILGVARLAGVPVVQTLHDYHHICASGDLMRGGAKVCLPPACGLVNVGPAVVNRCRHHSASVSLLLGCETASAHLRRVYEKAVTRCISPSRFLADIHAEAGWDKIPMDLLPNASEVGAHPRASDDPGSGFVYAGRLSFEKGVGVLLDAAQAHSLSLTVIGEGPDSASLQARAHDSVSFRGRLALDGVQDALRGCRAAVVPSIFLENLPMAVIEAMLMGVPVVASRLGGIPEIIRDGIDGFLVEPGDSAALGRALLILEESPELAVRMGNQARDRARALYSPGEHMKNLLGIYGMAMAGTES